MSTPADAMASGLKPQDREFLDLRTVTQIKNPGAQGRSLLTKEETGAIRAAQAAAPPTNGAPASSLAGLPQVPSLPTPGVVPPMIESPAQLPSPVQGAPQPMQAPNYLSRMQKLYGPQGQANAAAAASEARLTSLIQRLEARLSPESIPQQVSQPAQPASYGYSGGYGSPEPAANPQAANGAGAFVTRADLLNVLSQHTQLLAQRSALENAHIVSRREAELDFPDMFADPNLRDLSNQVLLQDKFLQQDPHGPYKAVAFARGLVYGGNQSSSGAALGPSVTQRKEMAAGIGASVPEGAVQSPDQAARYHAARERAAASGRPEDAVQMRLIQLGLA